jgi:nucleoside 2-deoxyribosyltransferase
MQIYLAGPDVFRPDPLGHGASLKALCRSHGADGLFPMDNQIPLGTVDVPATIRALNMDMIHACDAIVANLAPFRGPSMDAGTAYEIGAGAALGRIVVGYGASPRSYVDRVRAFHPLTEDPDGTLRDPDGLAVERFHADGTPVHLIDNLMIAHGLDALCVTADQAIARAVALWHARPGVLPLDPAKGSPLESLT